MAGHFDLKFDMSNKDKDYRRFQEVSSVEKNRILHDIHSSNTKKATEKSIKIFREWMRETGRGKNGTDFVDMSKVELNKLFQNFWLEVRTVDGKQYKKSSLQSIRSGLNRCLQESPAHRTTDITKDTDFLESNRCFKGMCKELKRIGKGGTTHHEPLTENDLTKCYTYLTSSSSELDSNPKILQEKVFFDLMFHLIRRGRENLRLLTKSHFAVATDSHGVRYIFQRIDEATKNHADDDHSPMGRVSEVKRNPGCPVRSFELYISKLSSDSDHLFQQPKRSVIGDQWYDPVPLGHNTIGQMMARISSNANLSRKYTNHCLRSTSITLLDDAKFESRHIMTVSGHRSELSLKSYSHHTSDKIKHQMSETLNQSVGLTDVQAKDTEDTPLYQVKNTTSTSPPTNTEEMAVQPIQSVQNTTSTSPPPNTEEMAVQPIQSVQQAQDTVIAPASLDLLSDEIPDSVLSQITLSNYEPPQGPRIYNSVVNIYYR